MAITCRTMSSTEIRPILPWASERSTRAPSVSSSSGDEPTDGALARWPTGGIVRLCVVWFIVADLIADVTDDEKMVEWRKRCFSASVAKEVDVAWICVAGH